MQSTTAHGAPRQALTRSLPALRVVAEGGWRLRRGDAACYVALRGHRLAGPQFPAWDTLETHKRHFALHHLCETPSTRCVASTSAPQQQQASLPSSNMMRLALVLAAGFVVQQAAATTCRATDARPLHESLRQNACHQLELEHRYALRRVSVFGARPITAPSPTCTCPCPSCTARGQGMWRRWLTCFPLPPT